MIYLSMPVGSKHGWGLCGKHIALQMRRWQTPRLLTRPFTADDVGDELDEHALRQLLPTNSELAEVAAGRVLHCIMGKELTPFQTHRGVRNVGYTFFEENLLPAESAANAARYYDLVVTGSTWCTDTLREHGVSQVSTILQGIDPELFSPAGPERQFFKDQFVVFSGGKFEFRKGQDIVIRAVKVLQQKYADVILATAWWNFWPHSVATMHASTQIRFAPTSQDLTQVLRQVLADNGIDLARTILCSARPNHAMARLYHNSDVGLFPNRCEGGTNLVLMEYMACGKPVIAANTSGHRDILTAENSLRIENSRPIVFQRNQQAVAKWDDPDLDETIAHLEYAYANRERLAALGAQAGRDLSQRTWAHTARQFLDVLECPS